MKQTLIKSILCMLLAVVSITANAQVKEFERYSDGNAALEQFCIDGKSLIHLIDELEEVEAV